MNAVMKTAGGSHKAVLGVYILQYYLQLLKHLWRCISKAWRYSRPLTWSKFMLEADDHKSTTVIYIHEISVLLAFLRIMNMLAVFFKAFSFI